MGVNTLHMKPATQRTFLFVTKSMLWSLLLYTVFMLALNWDDVSNKVRGINPITIVNSISAQPSSVNKPSVIIPAISRSTGIIKGLINLVSSLHVSASIIRSNVAD